MHLKPKCSIHKYEKMLAWVSRCTLSALIDAVDTLAANHTAKCPCPSHLWSVRGICRISFSFLSAPSELAFLERASILASILRPIFPPASSPLISALLHGQVLSHTSRAIFNACSERSRRAGALRSAVLSFVVATLTNVRLPTYHCMQSPSL